jgi:hypothetical protein
MAISRSKFLLLLIIMSTVFCGYGWAQAVAGMGAISGMVYDQSGAVVPGAQVVISNPDKGITRTLVTTDAGVFSAPSLVPSSGYNLTVTMAGFAKWEAKDFGVLVGQTLTFKVTLQVTTAATQVEVTGVAPLVEDNKTGVTQVVEQSQIDNLPINGRRADTFVLVTPAVTDDGTFGLVSFRGIAGGNSFLTDGNDTTNSFYNENAGRTRISTQISQDAVQEFQVLSNGFSAEFGRALGGVINTVTRSGTNDVHGTAYWFFRNRTLNAVDRYANGVNPPEWRHQAGASIGGPIKTDKVFYFGNFEIVKRNFPALNRIINNSLTDASGNNITASCTATAAQCAAAIGFIQRQMNVVVPRTVSSAMGFLKFDYRPTERNTFSFSGNVMHWRSPYGIQTQAVLTNNNAIAGNGNSTVETRYGKASWTSIIRPNLLNEVRFGYFKDRLSDPAASDLWPKETGGLSISVAGTAVGAAEAYPRTYPSEQRFQIADNLSWTYGAHSMKFGADFSTTEDWLNQLYRGLGGYSYSTLTAFAKDFSGNTTNVKNYSNFQQTFGNPIQDFRTTDIAVFAQDVWRVTRKLTLNYGARYEHTFIPQPWIANPSYAQTGVIPSPNKNFAPRASLSYMITDKTVLRMGYGIFWARFHANGLDTLLLGNGVYQPAIYVIPSNTGSPVFPNVFTSATGLPAGSVSLAYASPDFHNPYTQQGNVAIERELTHNLGLTVSYIWSRGIGIWTQRDVNLGAAAPAVTYKIQDISGNQNGTYSTPVYITGNKADKNFSKILQVENGGQSWYNGLAVQLRKRMSHGLSANVSYTWSHAIDDADMQGASWNIGWNYNNVTTPGDYRADKGSSSLDQRHRLVISFVYEPKFDEAKVGAAGGYLLNGWQLSTITTLASAHPTSGTVSVSGTQFTGVSLANSTLNGSGGWTRVPFWPVNSLDIDQYHRVDARLTRQLFSLERAKLYFAFEAFNLTNSMTDTGINTAAYQATSGVLKPYANLGTGNQSQGFPDGTNARRCQVALRLTF